MRFYSHQASDCIPECLCTSSQFVLVSTCRPLEVHPNCHCLIGTFILCLQVQRTRRILWRTKLGLSLTHWAFDDHNQIAVQFSKSTCIRDGEEPERSADGSGGQAHHNKEFHGPFGVEISQGRQSRGKDVPGRFLLWRE